MKQLIFFIFLIFSAWNLTGQCDNKEACLSFTKGFTENNPKVPNNIPEVFKGEIAGKIAVEAGIITSLPAVGYLVVGGAGAGLAVGGTVAANTSGWGSGYNIGSWAPYLEFKPSQENKSVGQTMFMNVDVFKMPNNSNDRFIAIKSNIQLIGNDEFADGYNIIRSKYVDKYSFSIKPVGSGCTLMESIPKSVNKNSSYTQSISWGLNGNVSASASIPPSAGGSVGGSFSYTVSSATNFRDFEIKNNPQGNEAIWGYNMKTCYDGTNAILYENPNDIIVNGALTKWLKKPADLAMGQNKLDMVSLYKINATRDFPAVFHYESVQQVMHAEVIGRWGVPGAYVGGIAVTVPAFLVIKGSITVDPDPANPANTTITEQLIESKYYTLQQYMDMRNQPLPTLNPPVLPGGCYALKNVNTNKYITHGGGTGVVNYHANRDKADIHEKINLAYTGKSKDGKNLDLYCLYSQDGRFLSSQPTGAVFKAENPVVEGWESWILDSISGSDKFYIRSYAHNRWLSADAVLGGIVGTSENKKAWEEWRLEKQSGGCPVAPVPTKPSAPVNGVNGYGTANVIPVINAKNDFYLGTSGNSGQLTPSQVAMLENRAVDVSGQSNVTIPGNLTQNLAELTIEAWVNNPSVENDIQAIVSAAGPEFVHFQISNDQGANNAVYLTDNRTVALPVVPKLSPGWHHVALVVKSGDSRVYLDGQMIGQPNPMTFSGIKPANAFYIGKGWSGERKFKGKIANVRIWNKAKSQQEITDNLHIFHNGNVPGLSYYSPTNNPLLIANETDCVNIPGSFSSDCHSLTVEAWVKGASAGPEIQAIVSATGLEFIHLQTSSNPNVKNAVYLDDNRTIQLPCIPALTIGEWHHVALVVESGNSRVYLDGQQVGTADNTTFSAIKPASTLYIGKGWSGGRLFNGNIADVRIWKNKALSQAQVNALRFTPPFSPADGLVYHYN